MAGRDHPSQNTTSLCRRCKVLQLCDGELGGRVELSGDGDEYVSFGPSEILYLDYTLEDTYPGLPGLSSSSSAGCAFCSLLRDQLVAVLHWRPGEAAVLIHKLCYRPIAKDILSDDGLQGIHKLLEVALKDVDPAQATSYLPTRLIDVGGKDGVGDPRLVLSREHWPSGSPTNGTDDRRYIALSYCWGPHPELQLKTESATLRERIRGIQPDAFPQTLRDAVLVCRALDVRYIWIDALCIIQGDKSDWERESSEMADVYSNSFLTICAAKGDSCLDGFLERSGPEKLDIPFQSSLRPSVSGSFSISRVPYVFSVRQDGSILGVFSKESSIWVPGPRDALVYDGSPHDPFKGDVCGSRWNKRGWTFQEASVSPRLLLFGRNMAHLYVGGNVNSEDGTYSFRGNEWDQPLRRDYGQSEDAEQEALRDWAVLAQSYFRRELSCQADKLPAISGLARHFSSHIRGKFVAGLWTSDLHYTLLWATTGTNTHEESPGGAAAAYTGPSWSWASQPRTIEWVWAHEDDEPRVLVEPEFRLLGANSTVDGLNEFGRVKEGLLFLSARICRLPAARLRRKGEYVGRSFPNELLSGDGQRIAHLRFDWETYGFEDTGERDTSKKRKVHLGRWLSMVLISSCHDTAVKLGWDEVSDPGVLLGLLVLPRGNKGDYKRVGLFLTEARGLCGREFWDRIEAQNVRLV